MAEVSQADRERANRIVINWRVNFDPDDDQPLVNMIGTYLADERGRARAPFLALIPTLEEQARLVSEDANYETDRPSFSDGRALGLHEAIDEISRAAEDAQ